MCAQIAHRLSADVDYIPIRHPIAGLDHGVLQPERARLAVGQRRGLRKRSARGEKLAERAQEAHYEAVQHLAQAYSRTDRASSQASSVNVPSAA